MTATEDRLTETAVRTAQPSAKSAGVKRRRQAPSQASAVHTDAHPNEGDEQVDASLEASLSDEDRISLFVDSMQDSVLPDLPPIPGYHVCWLTTTNGRDPIARRLRAGYSLIRTDELPGWGGVSLKTGDYSGCVGINEMVAAKIPIAAYQRAMQVLHHERPLAEEAKLRVNVDMMKQNAAQQGAQIVEEGDGTADLGKGTPAPRFAA